ncbi:hypothetical protein ATG66_0200 [Vibrio sp. ES.051]|nr:hypothetical protein ATG66_0200 [Vibrio sp. ES.051]
MAPFFIDLYLPTKNAQYTQLSAHNNIEQCSILDISLTKLSTRTIKSRTQIT